MSEHMYDPGGAEAPPSAGIAFTPKVMDDVASVMPYEQTTSD
jgi:hypothetical protein